MEIRKEKKDSALSMAIEGRIDTTTAPQAASNEMLHTFWSRSTQ